ncbi:MAG: hypothetical protein M3394_01540 [Actinomycetota bacterium]|nr:hypothetical protein [Actinomycetota bacterium]
MRRTRLLTYLIALVTLLTGALVFVPGASADTATPDIAYEAWFGRAKGEDPQTNTCLPGSLPPPVSDTSTPVDDQYATTPVDDRYNETTTRQCGALSPVDVPAPNSKATGHYVVASAGGQAGDSDAQGDIGWAAFQWDTFEFFGASADKFEVRLHLGLDRCRPGDANRTTCENQGDTYHGDPNQPVPPIQACNILDAWSGEPGPNPWITRPKVSPQCIVPKQNPNNLREFIFDVTAFADSWLEGKGHGFVVRPGTPDRTTNLPPFQMTFSGYYDPGTESAGCNPVGVPQTGTTTTTTPSPTVDPQAATGGSTSPANPAVCTRTPPGVLPKVTFTYTPAPEDDFEDFEDFEDLGGEDFSEDIDIEGEDVLEPEPDLDVIPTDVGSEEFVDDAAGEGGGEDEVAAGLPDDTSGGGGRPISNTRDTPFPWIILLLLPLMAMAFWSTGTALGPMGDPVTARRGGVSRVLAERQAAHRGSDTRIR